MALIEKGRYAARLADDAADVRRAQALRARVFRPGQAAEAEADAFDALCRHMLIEDRESGDLVSCFRILSLTDGTRIDQSYSAQFYDLSPLHAHTGPMAEIGRFCISPGIQDPDILRLAWGALTAVVDSIGARFLFGCSSFRGTEPAPYLDAFALLRDSHLGPDEWRPGIKAPAVFTFAENPTETPDPMRAIKAIPPLLRSYLAIGGWVSDHAVIDGELGTLHVFTGLDIGAVPEARKKLLRAMSQPG